MKTPKKRPITDKEQRIAAEILTAFMFTKDMDDVMRVWKAVYNQFALCDDPFTGCPCSSKEYLENRAEHDRQIMIDRYGHCDGLEG